MANIHRVIQCYGPIKLYRPKLLTTGYTLIDASKIVSDELFGGAFLEGAVTTVVNNTTRCITYKGHVFVIETVKEL